MEAVAAAIRSWQTYGHKVMILVFGKTGQIATELQQFDEVFALGRGEVDLSDPSACAEVIRKYAPIAVINAAAYTAVDRAEDEAHIASVINGEAPAEMARACLGLHIPLVHISTDYVFKGAGDKPHSPYDATDPQNAYGRSKLLGEIGIRNSGAIHAILRTSWVFSAHGVNFLKTMLHLSETRSMLSIVADQVGGPTPARDIAVTCVKIAKRLIQDPFKSGTYHFSGTPNVSWAEFAAEIFVQADRPTTITPILASDYLTPATRPLNSRMDCVSTEQSFKILRPNWHAGLNVALRDLEVIS